MIFLYNNTDFKIVVGSVYIDATREDSRPMVLMPKSWYKCQGKGIDPRAIEQSLQDSVRGQLYALQSKGRIRVAADMAEYKLMAQEIEAENNQTARVNSNFGISTDTGASQGGGIYGKALQVQPRFKYADLIEETDDGIPLMKQAGSNGEVDELKAQIAELKSMMLNNIKKATKAKPVKKQAVKKILKITKKTATKAKVKATTKAKPKLKVKGKIAKKRR